MASDNDGPQNEQAPWWAIGVLFLMLVPFALLAYLAFHAVRLVWRNVDGTVAGRYALVVFGVGGILIVVYLTMVVRHIYKDFIIPKLAHKRSTASPPKNDLSVKK